MRIVVYCASFEGLIWICLSFGGVFVLCIYIFFCSFVNNFLFFLNTRNDMRCEMTNFNHISSRCVPLDHIYDLIYHSLIGDWFRDLVDTEAAISLTYVVFHVQFSGLFQIIEFLCARNIVFFFKMELYLVWLPWNW